MEGGGGERGAGLHITAVFHKAILSHLKDIGNQRQSILADVETQLGTVKTGPENRRRADLKMRFNLFKVEHFIPTFSARTWGRSAGVACVGSSPPGSS